MTHSVHAQTNEAILGSL